LSLGYDHRIIDGAVAGNFVNEIISLLSTPSNFVM
jgi:pyruvate/2-oxoglutarate dehydrogenase complex dihydrolipoamide acyltransferase (E2) component